MRSNKTVLRHNNHRVKRSRRLAEKKTTDLLFDLLGSLVDLEEGGAIQQSLLMENADIAEHNQLPQMSSEQHEGKRKKQKITIINPNIIMHLNAENIQHDNNNNNNNRTRDFVIKISRFIYFLFFYLITFRFLCHHTSCVSCAFGSTMQLASGVRGSRTEGC